MSTHKDSKEQLDIYDAALNSDSNILVDAKAGTGKCLGKGTKILMYDGSIKNVEHIVVGDVLMGDDSTPRNVLSTTTGKGGLFKISPTKNKSFICNDVHILSLKKRVKTGVFFTADIPLDIFLKKSVTDQKMHYLYREVVDFNNETSSDYFLLGKSFFKQKHNANIINTTSENRRKIFASIVNNFGVVQYSDIRFYQRNIDHNIDIFTRLVESLGYTITYYEKGYNGYLVRGDFRLLKKYLDDTILDDLILESKHNYNIYKFNVEYVGIGNYYGFELDGNKRFLLDNFIVTHNTTTIKGIVNRILENKPELKIATVAFNNHISKELKTKLPEAKNLKISTTHAIGFGAILRKYKNAIVDEDKVMKIIEKKSKSWRLNPEEINISQYKMNLQTIVSLCKLTLSQTPNQINFIANKYGYKIEPLDVTRIRSILEASLNDTKTFDFNDMVFVPSIDSKLFIIQNDYVIVDECLPSTQKIVTKNGAMTIKDIYKHYQKRYHRDIKVLSYNFEKNITEYKPIERVWKSSDKKDVYRVKTDSKFSVKTTLNHKHYVWDNISNSFVVKTLENVKVGDYLFVNNNNIFRTKVGSKDINDYMQSLLMTRVMYSKKNNAVSFEIARTDSTIKNYQEELYKLGEKLKTKMGSTENRLITAAFYNDNYEFNRFNFIKNVMNEKHLAIIYMDTNFKRNPRNKFSIKAESFDHFLICKKLIEKRFLLKELSYRLVKSKKYELTVDPTQEEYFWNLIKNYLTKEYNENSTYNWDFTQYDAVKISSIDLIKRNSFVYDINVKHNMNFFTTNKSTDGILVHNCQDYNRAQQQILTKMLKKETGKLIAFGDKNQAIYGFMGADIDAFNWFSNRENTITLPLTTTYRCAKNIVKLAQKIVPNIYAKEDAIDGVIRYGSVIDDATDGDYVLCRKNAPLIKLVFDLLDNNKVATILGKEIGDDIKNKIKNLRTFNQIAAMITNNINDTIADLVSMGISDFETHPKYVAVRDNMEIIRNLMRRTKSIGEILMFIDKIFSDKPSGIILSTIHKSKGLEADRVFIVKPNEMKVKSPIAWMNQAEINLEYIAYTRAKNELIIDKDWDNEQA